MAVDVTAIQGELQPRLQQLLQHYISKGKCSGAVAVIAGPEAEQPPVVVTRGVLDTDRPEPMETDTIFRIYSLTKPVTSVAALMLAERGLLALDDAIADYIPAFADVQVLVSQSGRESSAAIETERPVVPPTVRDLLLHTSGIGGTHVAPDAPLAEQYRAGRFDDRNQTLEQLVDKLAEIPLLFQPGQDWRYGISTDVLARVVEVASGQSFDRFLQDNIFDPLAMHDTGFYVEPANARRLATVYGPDARGGLRPLQALGAETYTTPPALHAGSSGLVSTPRDYLNFARMLLGNGTWGNHQLLRPDTVQSMATNQLPSTLLPYRLPWAHAGHFTEGAGFGLGVRVLLDAAQSGVPGSVGEYGWAGAANTFVWIDPKRQLVLLLFTQAFPFLHTDIDRRFKQIVHESLPS